MQTKSKLLHFLAALSLIVPGCFSARAQMITVADSGFEAYDSALTSGNYTGEGSVPAGTDGNNPIPGWTLTTQLSGIQNGQIPQLYNGANSNLQGHDFAYNDGTAPFYQVLSGSGSTIVAGTYTLTVALGQRPNTPDLGAIFSLYTANGNALGTQLATSGIVGATANGAGTFSDYSINLVVAPDSPFIGSTLAIALGGANNKSSGTTGNDDFDNVRLSLAVAPEPSTYALMLGGILALAAMARARKLASAAR